MGYIVYPKLYRINMTLSAGQIPCRRVKLHGSPQGTESPSISQTRMGIVVGVISATGGSLFSGRSVRLEAAAKVKADAHGFPVEASASLLIFTKASASRQLDNNSAEVCPIMSYQFHWKLLSWLFCL